MKKLIWTVCFLTGLTVMQAQDFKAIGYLPYYRFDLIDDIEIQKITHLNIAFANPDMQGNLSVGGKNIDPIVQWAHTAGVDVFISLAGGALLPEWADAWVHLTKPINRSAFIHRLIRYANDHNLQGIDVDLEWSHVDHNYSGFVLELRDSVNQHDLGLTAALPGTYRYPEITDAALNTYDWINMMVYDLTGPWAPNNPGPHSPFSFAVNATVYWVNQGVPPEQLTLGMPFYGYDFTDQSNVSALTYRTIVGFDPDNAYRDQYGQIYYNGIPIIRQKTEYALAQLSGVMIWELGQDHFGEFSLLDQVDEVIQSAISHTDDITGLSINVYPNPFTTEIHVRANENIDAQIIMMDMQGRIIINETMKNLQTRIAIPQNIPSGMFALQCITEDQVLSYKLVKQ